MRETVADICLTVCYAVICLGVAVLTGLTMYALLTKVFFGCIL